MDIMISIIYKAVLENNVGLVKQALNEYNISLKDVIDEKHNEHLLRIAIQENFPDMVFFLVNNGADVNSNKTVDVCPLIFAISRENIKMTELLLDLGANIGEGRISQKVICPLHYAVSALNLEIVLLLLARGANVYARDVFNNETALHLVSHYNYVYSSEEDVKQKMQIQVKIAKALLDKGAVIDARNCNDLTPLDCALETGKTELCKLLFKEGAPVKKTQADGTHLEYLKFVLIFPCPELTRLCLERGCDFKRKDEVHSFTPYHCALEYSKPDIVKVFLEFNCPFDLPPFLPGTANVFSYVYRPNNENLKILSVQKSFIEGVKSNSLQSVKSALSEGAIPKGCSMSVPSTLHLVAENGNHELAELLLKKGVPANTVNTKRETPLFIAFKNKNVQACETFLKFGACINFVTSNNNSIQSIYENFDKLQRLFKLINKCFKLVKQGNRKVLKIIVKNYNLPDDNSMLSLLMNCVNRKGLSLMAMALEMRHTKLAEDLMKLRIEKL